MSLKVEQILDNNTFTNEGPRIYSTGAYLVPMEINKNGKIRFVWVVDEFEDDSYDKNGELCSPKLYVSKRESLLND
jgi:hypothetical protein